MSLYSKFERCIFTIELTENSKHIKFSENRKDITDPNNASYDTNEYKIVEITDMVTNEKLSSYKNFIVDNIYKKKKYYVLSYIRAFYFRFEKDDNNLFFENGYTGNVNIYTNNGSLISEYYMVNGKKEGELKEYKKNKLNLSINYINGIKHGLYKEYYDNGNIRIECNYSDEQKHGLYKKYYDNGNIRIECNYIDDKKNSEYKEYYDNGQIKEICNYIDDKKNGEYKEYYDNGQLYIDCNYSDNKKDGLYKEYDSQTTVSYSYYKKNKQILELNIDTDDDNYIDNIKNALNSINSIEFINSLK